MTCRERRETAVHVNDHFYDPVLECEQVAVV